jgi:hypothetical protein
MIRITPEEALNYTPLISGDPHICRKATAFTLTPSTEPKWKGWEDVTYYTDGSVPDYMVHPLEVMYEEWKNLDIEGSIENARNLD